MITIKKTDNYIEIESESAKDLLTKYIEPLGFNNEEVASFVGNILLAEMAGQPSHGFARAIWVMQNVLDKKLHSFENKPEISYSVHENMISVNANNRLGTYAFT